VWVLPWVQSTIPRYWLIFWQIRGCYGCLCKSLKGSVDWGFVIWIDSRYMYTLLSFFTRGFWKRGFVNITPYSENYALWICENIRARELNAKPERNYFPWPTPADRPELVSSSSFLGRDGG
jgi:hypothetical protein